MCPLDLSYGIHLSKEQVAALGIWHSLNLDLLRTMLPTSSYIYWQSFAVGY